MTTQAVAQVVERNFVHWPPERLHDWGEEGSGAFVVGLRYGKGTMHKEQLRNLRVYCTARRLGLEIGGNASKCFTLVYQNRRQEEIFQRYPGVEGSYYFIAGYRRELSTHGPHLAGPPCALALGCARASTQAI